MIATNKISAVYKMNLPKNKINVERIGRVSERAIKAYASARTVSDLVIITEGFGIKLSKNKKLSEKQSYQFWANEMNKDIEVANAIKTIDNKKKKNIKQKEGRIKGLVTPKFNTLTFIKKDNYTYDNEVKLSFIGTRSSYLKKARGDFDKMILDTIQNSPVVGYILPNGTTINLENTDVNQYLSNSFDFSNYINFAPIPKKVKKSRIKDAGAMELDTFVKNDTWDTGTNKCVPDWIIHKYSGIKGFQKMCNYENIQKLSLTGLCMDECDKDEIHQTKNPNIYGYTREHIRNLCKNMGINLYILDNGVLDIYDKQEEVKRKVPLVIEIKNNHLYPITDKHIISKISSIVGGNLKTIKNDNVKQLKKDEIKILVKVFNNENIDPWDWMIQKMNETNTMVYKSDNVTIINGKLQRFHLNGTDYICNYDENLHKFFGNEYVGQTEIAILKDYITDIPKSYLNNEIKNALFTENVKNRTHYGVINNEISPNDDAVIKYDINKHYKNVMLNPCDDWCIFDFNSTIEEKNLFDNVFGLYFVETTDLTLLHKDNWYSNTILQYAQDNGIEFTCKFFIKGNRQKNMFKEIIEKIETDIEDKAVKKMVINAISGSMGKTHSTNIKAILDTDTNRVWNDYIKLRNVEHKELYYKKFDKIHIVGEKTTKELVNNNVPIYIQILDFANINLHKHIKSIGGTLIARKTDAFWIYEPINEPVIDDSIGGLKYEEKTYVGEMNTERNVVYNHDVNELIKSEICDSNDYRKIIEIIKKKSFMLQGVAGTGKTFILKKIKKLFGNKCICTAFTNKAKNNFKGGITINKLFGMDKKGVIDPLILHNRLKGVTVIIIDEISMITTEIWKVFEMIKQTKNIRFVLAGDYHQLPPIEDGTSVDCLKNKSIAYISDNIMVKLTEMKRYDSALHEFSKQIYAETVTPIVNKRNISHMIKASCNIVWTNRMRKEINSICNEHHKGDNFINVPYTGEVNKYNEDINVYNGVKLLCNTTNDEYDLCKNETLIVDRFDEKYIYIGKRVIPLTKLHDLFMLGYAITVYKAQGDTYDGLINIFEVDMLMRDKRYIYTAVTRATKLIDVNFMD
jgi:hypothetical protein